MEETQHHRPQLGARIRKLREDRELSQEQVAEKIEVSPQYFSRPERAQVLLRRFPE